MEDANVYTAYCGELTIEGETCCLVGIVPTEEKRGSSMLQRYLSSLDRAGKCCFLAVPLKDLPALEKVGTKLK